MIRKWALILSGLMIGLISVSILIGQPPGDPDSPTDGEVITGIVEFNGATVYVGPDFAYDPIAQLPKNTQVVVLGRRGDFFTSWDGNQWLEIEFEDETGWVYARLIRTSIPFNSIPPTGRRLPRDGNRRVPQVFDLSDNVCDRWVGDFTRTGDFLVGDAAITVTFPALDGANVYSVIVIAPSGERYAFDSETTTVDIPRNRLPRSGGTYTWRVAPYWTNRPERWNWQQVCLLQTGGTFDIPGEVITPRPTRTRPPYYYYYGGGTPTPTPPLVP